MIGTMLTPELAAIILLVICVLLLIVVPMLDGSKRFSKFISLRYTLVSVTLIMALGCVLDFSHLAESSRNIVLMGGIILVGIFVAVRSIEKLKLGGKKIELSIEKGDAKVSTTIQGVPTPVKKEDKCECKKTQIETECITCMEDERDDEE